MRNNASQALIDSLINLNVGITLPLFRSKQGFYAMRSTAAEQIKPLDGIPQRAIATNQGVRLWTAEIAIGQFARLTLDQVIDN
jgi:hypothetical protein